MKRNDLFLKNDIIYRVLYIDEPKILIIDCVKKVMPYWIHIKFLIDSKQITEDELLEATGIDLDAFKCLSLEEQAEAQKLWNSISNIVLFIHKDSERKMIFKACCEEYHVSRDTIRKRLVDYLVYQNIAILVKKVKYKKTKELSDDEKNFRWALNKYYYKGIQLSISECYRRMLKDKYCDENGKLLDNVPSLRRFRFYFNKTVNKENLIISRQGKGEYMRNHRVLLGDGVREFCPVIGYGMMDSTICDIFLVNDKGELLGRPVMTACVDAYSSMCLGYSLGWEGGINSLKSLVRNIICDKVEHCKKFGIDITIDDWNINGLPFKLITDRGREYIGDTFSQLTDLGIEMINLPPYRPELKGCVEKFFDIIQNYFKKELASKGVIFEDYQERGGIDYRKKACLTLYDFEKIILYCIIYYNTKRVIDLPYDKVGLVEPFANALWNNSLVDHKYNIISIDSELLNLTLLPRTEGQFRRNGLIVNGLRYKNYDYKNKFLEANETAVVAYNPNNVGKVWLLEKGNYVEFTLIEKFFNDMDLDKVNTYKDNKKSVEKEAERTELQGRIDLSRNIELVSDSVKPIDVDMKNVRAHRDNEIKKAGEIAVMAREDMAEGDDDNIMNSDLLNLKIVLRLGSFDLDKNCQVVVETDSDATRGQIENLSYKVKSLIGKSIIPVSFNKKIGQIIAQSIVSPLMSDVFLHLFSFDDAEFYSIDSNESIEEFNKTHNEAIAVAKLEKLFVLAEDEKEYYKKRDQAYEASFALKKNENPEKKTCTIFVIGENKKSDFILDNLNRSADSADFNYSIKTYGKNDNDQLVSDITKTKGEKKVLILSDDKVSAESYDANVFVTLIALTKAFPKRENITFITELLDSRNLSSVRDFDIQNTIISNKMMSLLITQLAMNDEAKGFFDKILTVDRADDVNEFDIAVMSAKDLILMDGPMEFKTKAELISSFYKCFEGKNILIGVGQKNELLLLNEGQDEKKPFILNPEDDLVYFKY